MLSEKKIKTLLLEQKLAPRKRLGQNFLINKNVASKIVNLAGIQPNDTIIELGVGFGALTKYLAEISSRVVGLEIDSGIVRYHKEEGGLPANVILKHQNILTADFAELAAESGGRLKIIANLPYSISNPLLFKLIDNSNIIEWAVLMLQKEVAERLTAKSGTKDYGVLTVRMAVCASVKKLLELGPQHFHPRPRVESQVVKIQFYPKPERAASLPEFDHILFKKVVNAAFQQRRKTLVNALAASNQFNADKPALKNTLVKLEIDPRIRGEKLSVENFVALTNMLQQFQLF